MINKEKRANKYMLREIKIKKYRGFRDVSFKLGSLVTVIAGQNGTQKTTLLGMLTQMFTLGKENPMSKEKPLIGGSYRSNFTEKFKFSPEFDKAGEHEWTLSLDGMADFTAVSIWREKGEGIIRFWQKGTKKSGSGYIQYPVLYLSLRRLFPIGEDSKVKVSNGVELTEIEKNEYKIFHDNVLFNVYDEAQPLYLEGQEKKTIGVNTTSYDWRSNSAGQDNLGKIVLALFSFKRLQENYPNDYKGGILAIDELDTTLFPASQIKILNSLISYASRLKIQIIFTSHSLTLIKESCKLQEECEANKARKGQVNVVFLKREDDHIAIKEHIGFGTIENNLSVSLSKKANTIINIYTEDNEGWLFMYNMVPAKYKSIIKHVNAKMSCSEYINLIEAKIPNFYPPEGLVVLDGDVDKDKNKHFNHVVGKLLLLPGPKSPELMVADWINGLSDANPFWESINPGYGKQYCFQDYHYTELNDRVKAKAWFQRQCVKEVWGTTAHRMMRFWKKDHMDEVKVFVKKFTLMINRIIKERGMMPEEFGL